MTANTSKRTKHAIRNASSFGVTKSTSATAEATPMVNGFSVAAANPVATPTNTIAPADDTVISERDGDYDKAGISAYVSSNIPKVVPPRPNKSINAGIINTSLSPSVRSK